MGLLRGNISGTAMPTPEPNLIHTRLKLHVATATFTLLLVLSPRPFPHVSSRSTSEPTPLARRQRNVEPAANAGARARSRSLPVVQARGFRCLHGRLGWFPLVGLLVRRGWSARRSGQTGNGGRRTMTEGSSSVHQA